MRSGRHASVACNGLIAAGVLAGTMTLAGAGAHAQQPTPQSQQPVSVYRYSLYKTLTYETVVNLADIPLYRILLAGSAATTPLFTAVNVGTATVAYYGHELLWNLYGPPERRSETTALEVGAKKLLLYRVVSTTRNLALAYAFTGSAAMSLSFALATNVLDATVYAANEYGWYRYGPPVRQDVPLNGTLKARSTQ